MLTQRQQDTLAFIRSYLARNDKAPSLAEIARAAGNRSRSAALRHVRALADAGYIELVPGRKRGIRLLGDAKVFSLELPLMGRIAAGRPIEAIAGTEAISVANFFGGSNLFALRVKGDSMIGAGIMDGDTVVVRPTSNADDGDIVVALIDSNEVTLKRLKRSGGEVTLLPENPGVKPATYEAGRVAIQGVVVGQMRRYD